MDSSDNLDLPYIMPSQAQKHVTHNEAIGVLDAIVQLSVLDRDLAAPPVSPANGDRYIVASGASGDWTGQAGKIAHRLDGAWVFHAPQPGFVGFVADEQSFVYWTGAAWVALSTVIGALQNLALLGIGTTADATNPFSAKLNKALWTAKTAAEGGDGDLRYAMNKEATADVVSFLLQKGFSGRAELGLIGDDDLTVKVSADGSAWSTAMVIDKATGSVRLPSGTSAAPGLQFGGSDLGIYRTGSGTSLSYAFAWNHEPLLTLLPATLVKEANSDTSGNLATFRRSRGTYAAKTAVQLNDQLFSLFGGGYTGAGFVDSGNFNFSVVAATPSATDMETAWILSLCGAGSVSRSQVLRATHASGFQMYGSNTVVDNNRHFRLRSYTVATLPTASPAGQMIYVSDGTSNKRLAVSDATNWRWPDGAVVS